ncbi:MAG: hypothetical protein ABL921_22440 [Pirellula sp.]
MHANRELARYYHVDQVFSQAVQNAPSIVFTDDCDVIFESGREHGLYRYLLTKLDWRAKAPVAFASS